MVGKEKETATYEVIETQHGNAYKFFCDISKALVCQTESFFDEDREKELELAWETEGKKHFNLCHKCGKWVSDVMYNPDVFNCVECSPLEEFPDYCPKCGTKVLEMTTFCYKCRARLVYGGEADEEGG